MVYQRIRNSHYAQYSRRMRNAGYSANFSIPLRSRASANFNMMDLVNAAGTYGGHFIDGAQNMGNQVYTGASDLISNVPDMVGNAKEYVGAAGQRLANTFNSLPMAGKLGPEIAGVAAAAGAGKLGYDVNRARSRRPAVEEVMPAVEEVTDVVAEGANGLRKAGAGAIQKLRGMNPKLAIAGAAGAGALGLGGAYAANRMRQQDQ